MLIEVSKKLYISLKLHYLSLNGMFVLVNNKFMWSKNGYFRVSVETSFDPIIHDELHPFYI